MERLSGIHLRGYTKKENGHWVAICIDLDIVAQGRTPDEATKKCIEMSGEYLEYVCKHYPDDFRKYIPRPAATEFIEEFNELMAKKIVLPPKRQPRRKLIDFSVDSCQLANCGV